MVIRLVLSACIAISVEDYTQEATDKLFNETNTQARPKVDRLPLQQGLCIV